MDVSGMLERHVARLLEVQESVSRSCDPSFGGGAVSSEAPLLNQFPALLVHEMSTRPPKPKDQEAGFEVHIGTAQYAKEGYLYRP